MHKMATTMATETLTLVQVHMVAHPIIIGVVVVTRAEGALTTVVVAVVDTQVVWAVAKEEVMNDSHSYLVPILTNTEVAKRSQILRTLRYGHQKWPMTLYSPTR